MPPTIFVHAIQEVGCELMLVGAQVTGTARAEIINDNGKLLTISIPDGLLPVNLIAELVTAGESREDIAEWYDLTVEQIDQAVGYFRRHLRIA